MSSELRAYLAAAAQAGMTPAETSAGLLSAGWTMEQVVAAFNALPAAPLASAPASGNAIDAINVTKSFGKVHALRGVTLAVPQGTVLALLGHNGAGKTTLVRLMATLMTPDDGAIRIAGNDTVRNAQAVRASIGLTGQYAAVDEHLTGRENLELIGRLSRMSKADAAARAQELLAQFNLAAAGDRGVKTYSGGMRRRLDLSASLVNRPSILFLDEPTTGLDPQSRNGMWDVIASLRASGTTILLTTQYLEEADRLADNVAVMDHGQIIAQGTPAQLKAKLGGDVVRVHLHDAATAAAAQAVLPGSQLHADDATVLTISAPRGAADLVAAVRELDRARITVTDISLSRPSLDDVFLSLTSHV